MDDSTCADKISNLITLIVGKVPDMWSEPGSVFITCDIARVTLHINEDVAARIGYASERPTRLAIEAYLRQSQYRRLHG